MLLSLVSATVYLATGVAGVALGRDYSSIDFTGLDTSPATASISATASFSVVFTTAPATTSSAVLTTAPATTSSTISTITSAVNSSATHTTHHSFTGTCDISYCEYGISWCHYWAGVTSFNPTLGILPGETITSLGPCTSPTADSKVKRRYVHDIQDVMNADTTSTTATASASPIITASPLSSSATPKCDYKWCQDGYQMCAKWMGITSWDSRGSPVPGEVVTNLGPCEVKAPVDEVKTSAADTGSATAAVASAEEKSKSPASPPAPATPSWSTRTVLDDL